MKAFINSCIVAVDSGLVGGLGNNRLLAVKFVIVEPPDNAWLKNYDAQIPIDLFTKFL